MSVRLARSESLKAQGEGRRRGAGGAGESVPRSRSDVDMDDCGEEREVAGLRLLQHSTSSSASSSSARSVLQAPTRLRRSHLYSHITTSKKLSPSLSFGSKLNLIKNSENVEFIFM